MKVLTIWQPWASLVIFGEKRIENRPWRPPSRIIGTRILIHAGKAYEDEISSCYRADVERLGDRARIMGAVIGTAIVRGITRNLGIPEGQARWLAGPFGWILDDVRPTTPIPCRGYQKLWNLPVPLWGQLQASAVSA